MTAGKLRSANWKGGVRTNHNGYLQEWDGAAQKYRLQHVAIAERALGKPLPPEAQVHHHDRDRSHNENSNLVICQDAAYHKLLHGRMRVLEMGGNPDTQRICSRCRHLKEADRFAKSQKMCRRCQTEYMAEYRQRGSVQ